MNVPDDDDCTVLVEAIKHCSTMTELILEEICHGDGDCTCGRIQTQLKNNTCLVPRPHYYARPMRFGSSGPRKFLRPRQTRRSETFCLTWGGAFGSGRAVNNFSALMKDV